MPGLTELLSSIFRGAAAGGGGAEIPDLDELTRQLVSAEHEAESLKQQYGEVSKSIGEMTRAAREGLPGAEDILKDLVTQATELRGALDDAKDSIKELNRQRTAARPGQPDESGSDGGGSIVGKLARGAMYGARMRGPVSGARAGLTAAGVGAAASLVAATVAVGAFVGSIAAATGGLVKLGFESLSLAQQYQAVSPQMAAIAARQEVLDLLRSMRVGAALAPAQAELQEELRELKDNWTPILIAIRNATQQLTTFVVRGVNAGFEWAEDKLVDFIVAAIMDAMPMAFGDAMMKRIEATLKAGFKAALEEMGEANVPMQQFLQDLAGGGLGRRRNL